MGAFESKEADDALRVEATPREAPFRERLAYTLEDATDSGVTLVLGWDKLAVPGRRQRQSRRREAGAGSGRLGRASLSRSASSAAGAPPLPPAANHYLIGYGGGPQASSCPRR